MPPRSMHLSFAINISGNSQKCSLQKQTQNQPTPKTNQTKKTLSPSWKKENDQTTLHLFIENASHKPAINMICCNMQDPTNLSVPKE